jgi:Glucose / Sorbosone dehydrogenase
VPQEQESDFTSPDFRPPVKTFYTVENGFNFKDPACADRELYFLCWPTIAPSSLSVYAGYEDGVPELADSLLLTSLKQGTVFRVALGPDGKPLEQEAERFFRTTNRYRDIAIAPTGRALYVATDNQGILMGPDGRPAFTIENPGAILEFRAP